MTNDTYRVGVACVPRRGPPTWQCYGAMRWGNHGDCVRLTSGPTAVTLEINAPGFWTGWAVVGEGPFGWDVATLDEAMAACDEWRKTRRVDQ